MKNAKISRRSFLKAGAVASAVGMLSAAPVAVHAAEADASAAADEENGLLDVRPKLDEKVPAVFVANPYMLHCNEDWYDLYDVNTDIQAYPSQNIQREDITFHPKDPVVCPKKEAEQIVESSPYPEPDPSAYECISDLYGHLLERAFFLTWSHFDF